MTDLGEGQIVENFDEDLGWEFDDEDGTFFADGAARGLGLRDRGHVRREIALAWMGILSKLVFEVKFESFFKFYLT